MQDNTVLTEIIILIAILVALVLIYYFTRRYRKPTQKQDSYRAALEALVDGDVKRAIQLFKEAIHQNSENIEAYLRLGDLLRERGLVKNALKIHKDLTFRTGLSNSMLLRVRRSLMLDYEALGEFDKAIEEARKLLEKENPYYRETASRLLQLFEKGNRWSEALEAANKYFKPTPAALKHKISLYHVFQGLKLQDEGRGKDARIKFKEALKINPQNEAAYYYLGKSYVEEDRLEDAVKEWVNLCTQIPEKAYIVFDELEKAWFELGNFSEAENLYSHLFEKNRDNIKAALALAEIYEKKGEYDRALELLERLDEEYPEDPSVQSFKVQVLYNKNQYKAACQVALNFLKQQKFIDHTIYQCQECHYISETPLWVCPQCKSIDSFNI